MPCDVNCLSCNVTGGDYFITDSFSPPQSASPGDKVTINFTVELNCWVCRGMFIACLYDNDTNTCVSSAGPYDFTDTFPIYKGKTIDASLSYTQQQTDFNASLNVIGIGPIGGIDKYCTDTKSFIVKSVAPVGQGYSCDSSTNTCYNDPNSNTTAAECTKSCGGGGPGLFTCTPACNKDKEICLLGGCVPKPLVFLGAVLVGIMIITRD